MKSQKRAFFAIFFLLAPLCGSSGSFAGKISSPTRAVAKERSAAVNALQPGCDLRFAALTRNATHINIGEVPPYPKNPAEQKVYGQFLRVTYEIEPQEVHWGEKYPVVLHGNPESAFLSNVDISKAVYDDEAFDVVVVGSGPAGLTAAAKAAEGGLKVQLLEQNKDIGGLAAGRSRQGVQMGTGAAYATAQEPGSKMNRIYSKFLGLDDFEETYAISENHHHPIDSFFWNGRYYRNWWEDSKVLNELPTSFALFKYGVEQFSEKGWVQGTPFMGKKLERLDNMDMAEFVRSLPAALETWAKRGDKTGAALLKKFRADAKVNQADPMKDVIGLLELYGRSALGDHPDKVSAQAFASFYVAEFGTRYTSNLGAGFISQAAFKKFESFAGKTGSQMKTEASVAQVRNLPDGTAEVVYVQNGEARIVKARKVIMSTPVNVAAKAVKDFDKIAPEAYQTIKDTEHRHYWVINVHTKGHPWTDSYDLWVRNDSTYSQNSITDIIDGRWMDHVDHPNAPRDDDRGVLSIFKPLPPEFVGKELSEAEKVRLTEEAVDEMRDILQKAQKASGNLEKPIEVTAVEANMWNYAVHVPAPGHIARGIKLEKPIGNVYLANNNMAVPAVEEAVYRGYDAAERVIKELKRENQAVKKAINPVERKPAERPQSFIPRSRILMNSSLVSLW